MVQELYACGFNAHSQLINSRESEDIPQPHLIATGTKTDVLFAGWADTLLSLTPASSRKRQILLAGHSNPIPASEASSQPNTDPSASYLVLDDYTSSLVSFHGTHRGLHYALSADHLLHVYTPPTAHESATASRSLLREAPPGPQIPSFTPSPSGSPQITRLAITTTDRVSIAIKPGPGSNLSHVMEFPCLEALDNWYADPSRSDIPPSEQWTHHMIGGRCAQLVATATCFVFLTESGEILTWGDARHWKCLGRTPSADEPAERPGKVDALGGIEVRKVAAGGGWIAAAISRDGALYIWGMGRPGEGERNNVIDALKSKGGESKHEEVKLVEGLGEMDVLDVGVGDGHVVALREDGKVFVAGDGDCGQLGLGKSKTGFVQEWQEMRGANKAMRVLCGPQSTFVVVEREEGGPA